MLTHTLSEAIIDALRSIKLTSDAARELISAQADAQVEDNRRKGIR